MFKRAPKKKERAGFYVYDDEDQLKSLRDNTLHPTCVIAEEDIEEFLVTGKGFYATVKVGQWTRPDNKKERVAIKCIREDVVKDHLGEILKEANNMAKLEHKNVIKLYGICLVTRDDGPCKVKLVTEYAPLGCLIDAIQDANQDHRIFFCQITRLWLFACQIAEGMQYLHSKNVIHFDLAARNVLLISPNLVRISDFGLARALRHDQKISMEKPIALPWCAPEVIKNQLATKGCDVWSYGVLLWEMFSFGEKPWSKLSSIQIVVQADRPEERLPQPQACSNGIYSLMQRCWSQNPSDRQNFTQIIECLKTVKPVVGSAKSTSWSNRPKELSFQSGTKITIIDRYGAERYLCQNEGAHIGFINQERINFDSVPKERKFETFKPKISRPSDMRHIKTASKNSEVLNCIPRIAEESSGDVSVDTKANPLQDHESGYTLMADKLDYYLRPPPVPVRANTLPDKKRRPVPKPRRLRPLSADGQQPGSSASAPTGSKGDTECTTKTRDEDLQKNGTEASAQSGTSNEQRKNEDLSVKDLHDSDKGAEELPKVNTEQEDGKQMLPTAPLPEGVTNSPPSPPQTSSQNETTTTTKDPDLDTMASHTKDQAQEDIPPPLPQKSFDRLFKTVSGQEPVQVPRMTDHVDDRSATGQTDNPTSRPNSERSEERASFYDNETIAGIEQIHSMFPEISEASCYVKMVKYKGDVHRILKILNVCNLTGVEEQEAEFHLGHCSWNVERAINYIFDNQ